MQDDLDNRAAGASPPVGLLCEIPSLADACRWKAEIESKTTTGLLKVLIHHGNQRSKSVNVLKQADVVLTTYGTIVSEFGKDPKRDPPRAQREDSFIEEVRPVRQKGELSPQSLG